MAVPIFFTWRDRQKRQVWIPSAKVSPTKAPRVNAIFHTLSLVVAKSSDGHGALREKSVVFFALFNAHFFRIRRVLPGSIIEDSPEGADQYSGQQSPQRILECSLGQKHCFHLLHESLQLADRGTPDWHGNSSSQFASRVWSLPASIQPIQPIVAKSRQNYFSYHRNRFHIRGVGYRM